MSELNPYQSPAVADEHSVSPLEWQLGHLRHVRTGLFTSYYGICTLLSAVVVGALVLAMSSMLMQNPVVGAIVVGLMALGLLGGAFAMFVGHVMCLWVPEQTRARSMATATVALQILLFLSIVGAFMYGVNHGNENPGTPLDTSGPINFILNMIFATVAVASVICFTVFLKRLNEFLSQPDLVRSANTVFGMVVGVLSFGLALFGMIAIFAKSINSSLGANGLAPTAGCFGLLFFLFGLITFVKYANLIVFTARAVGRAVADQEDGA